MNEEPEHNPLIFCTPWKNGDTWQSTSTHGHRIEGDSYEDVLHQTQALPHATAHTHPTR